MTEPDASRTTRDPLAIRDLAGALRSHLIGWIVPEGEQWPWPPSQPHGAGHTYDGRCAICRCGDKPEALDALVEWIIAYDEGEV